MADTDGIFFAGVLSALAIVYLSGNRVLFDDIVSNCGGDSLIRASRKSGNMRWSGMADYVRRHREVKRG